ncbi:MAG TPA: glycosyltransferase family 39 protein [Gaiellales bacterium]|jgi:dolichyl-phosphate-mannose--protein O-mannosyl transferase
MTSSRTWRAAACLLAVLAVGSFARLDGLGTPATFIADEGFYAPDGCVYAVGNARTCQRTVESTPEHPPLGKWLIGAGIRADGFTPTGWRLAPAVAGILTVGLLFVLALLLLDSVPIAAFTALLLAVEPLHVVQSRIATLDVFVAFFGLAAIVCAVLDVRRPSIRRLPPWRLAAGAAAGAAVASKWSGVLALVAVAALILFANRSRLRSVLPSTVVGLGAVPIGVYVLTFVGRVHGKLLALPWAHGALVRAFAHRQLSMWRNQTGHFATSAYQSPPWSWPLLRRADAHYISVSGGNVREVLAVGSPLIWWCGFAAAAAAVALAVRSRGTDLAALAVALGVGCTYVPWLLLAHGRSFVFLYYMTPVVPFLCLAVGWAAVRVGHAAVWAAPAFAVLSIALLVFWWPVLTARPVAFGGWRDRVVFHHCRPEDQPQRLPRDRNGRPLAWIRVLHGSPPAGWCWV